MIFGFNQLIYFWKHNKYYDAPLALFIFGHGSFTRNLNNLAKLWYSSFGNSVVDTLK